MARERATSARTAQTSGCAEALAVEAVQIMERYKVNQLLVVDERGRLEGALNMHDLFRAKVI
jgi:arabinose-5-phosphate isomerase